MCERQAADVTRSRIAWKYPLGMMLAELGFYYSVVVKFRPRQTAGPSEYPLVDKMLVFFELVPLPNA